CTWLATKATRNGLPCLLTCSLGSRSRSRVKSGTKNEPNRGRPPPQPGSGGYRRSSPFRPALVPLLTRTAYYAYLCRIPSLVCPCRRRWPPGSNLGIRPPPRTCEGGT
ncbi:hypothetical protein BDY21DRAFT_425251, partial [Lineolata rhizophorae]